MAYLLPPTKALTSRLPALPPAGERDRILRALRAAEGNVTHAARALGTTRKTLQARMREYKMPHGRPGRRKRLLPYRRSRWAWGLGAAAVAGALVVSRLT